MWELEPAGFRSSGFGRILPRDPDVGAGALCFGQPSCKPEWRGEEASICWKCFHTECKPPQVSSWLLQCFLSTDGQFGMLRKYYFLRGGLRFLLKAFVHSMWGSWTLTAFWVTESSSHIHVKIRWSQMVHGGIYFVFYVSGMLWESELFHFRTQLVSRHITKMLE